MKIYSKEDFDAELKRLVDVNSALLYKDKVINNYGKLKNSDIYTAELVIKYLLDKRIKEDKIKNIKLITREKSYYTKSHEKLCKIINKDSNRHEENLVKNLFNKNILEKDLGKCLDYQVPLKNTSTDIAGKIDLLTLKADTNELFMVEVKKENSPETLLKCILEIQTYSQIVNQDRLKKDFKKDSTTIRKAVAVPRNSIAAKEYEEINSESRAYLRKLIELFDIKVVVF